MLGLATVIIVLQACFECAARIPDTTTTTQVSPKTLCSGDGSFKTVYNQRCRVRKMNTLKAGHFSSPGPA